MTEPIVIETHRSPIYVVRFRGKATTEEYQAYLEQLTRLVNAPFEVRRVVINDCSEWVLSTPNERRMQSDWIKQYQRELKHTVDAIGFVFSSALMRGALRAVFWLQPLPVPHELFGNFEEALAWARHRVGTQTPVRRAASL